MRNVDELGVRQAWKDEGFESPGEGLAAYKALKESYKELFEQVREDTDEYDAILTKQATLLTGVATAIRGEPPELTSWSHHDVVELTEQVMEQLARFCK